jgi:DNA-binding response OmpR family regulator
MTMVEVKRIIVCDDNQDIADCVLQVLRQQGYETSTVNSALDCLTKIEEQLPDLIVLDIRMPKHDGFWLAENLECRGIKVPIIFLTAFDRPIYRIYAPVVGAVEFLTKPIEPELLLETVRKVLARKPDENEWMTSPRRKSGQHKAV